MCLVSVLRTRRYHVVNGAVLSKDLKDMELIKTVEGKNVLARLMKGGGVRINSANVILADVVASNGVVHIVDQVLSPDNRPKTIVEVLPGWRNGGLSTLVAALNAAGLADKLSGKGPFTLFAPTNNAFAALPFGTVANLLKPENRAQLVNLLSHHVVRGKVLSSDLKDMDRIDTLQAGYVTVRNAGDGILINSAKGVQFNLGGYTGCLNGVVHVIDQVLLPGSG